MDQSDRGIGLRGEDKKAVYEAAVDGKNTDCIVYATSVQTLRQTAVVV